MNSTANLEAEVSLDIVVFSSSVRIFIIFFFFCFLVLRLFVSRIPLAHIALLQE